MTIEFGILGRPLATPLARTIGASRRREWTIIAALVLRPNDLVTTESLIDALWDGDAPRTAREQVLNCIGLLRRALGSAESAAIVRDGDRHMLVVDPERVDHVVFDRLRRTAERHAQEGDAGAAASAYRSALDLWRGRAFDGVPLRSLAPAATHLDELLAAATESYFDACLALGTGPQTMAEIMRYVGDYPLRERGVAQLMLALHQAGRRHDACAAFRALAERLDVELGITPGPEVTRTLHLVLDIEPGSGLADMRTRFKPLYRQPV